MVYYLVFWFGIFLEYFLNIFGIFLAVVVGCFFLLAVIWYFSCFVLLLTVLDDRFTPVLKTDCGGQQRDLSHEDKCCRRAFVLPSRTEHAHSRTHNTHTDTHTHREIRLDGGQHCVVVLSVPFSFCKQSASALIPMP